MPYSPIVGRHQSALGVTTSTPRSYRNHSDESPLKNGRRVINRSQFTPSRSPVSAHIIHSSWTCPTDNFLIVCEPRQTSGLKPTNGFWELGMSIMTTEFPFILHSNSLRESVALSHFVCGYPSKTRNSVIFIPPIFFWVRSASCFLNRKGKTSWVSRIAQNISGSTDIRVPSRGGADSIISRIARIDRNTRERRDLEITSLVLSTGH